MMELNIFSYLQHLLMPFGQGMISALSFLQQKENIPWFIKMENHPDFIAYQNDRNTLKDDLNILFAEASEKKIHPSILREMLQCYFHQASQHISPLYCDRHLQYLEKKYGKEAVLKLIYVPLLKEARARLRENAQKKPDRVLFFFYQDLIFHLVQFSKNQLTPNELLESLRYYQNSQLISKEFYHSVIEKLAEFIGTYQLRDNMNPYAVHSVPAKAYWELVVALNVLFFSSVSEKQELSIVRKECDAIVLNGFPYLMGIRENSKPLLGIATFVVVGLSISYFIRNGSMKINDFNLNLIKLQLTQSVLGYSFVWQFTQHGGFPEWATSLGCISILLQELPTSFADTTDQTFLEKLINETNVAGAIGLLTFADDSVLIAAQILENENLLIEKFSGNGVFVENTILSISPRGWGSECSMAKTTDGNIVFLGIRRYDKPLLIKLTNDLAPLWAYSFEGIEVDAITTTADNAIVVGSAWNVKFDYFQTLKFANNGTLLWATRIELEGSPSSETLTATSDNGIIIAANISLPKHSFIIAKLAADGNLQWATILVRNSGDSNVVGVTATPDGVIASLQTYNDNEPYPHDAWLIKWANNGTLLWTNQIQADVIKDYTLSFGQLVTTPDNNIICFSTFNYVNSSQVTPALMKFFNSNGSSIWQIEIDKLKSHDFVGKYSNFISKNAVNNTDLLFLSNVNIEIGNSDYQYQILLGRIHENGEIDNCDNVQKLPALFFNRSHALDFVSPNITFSFINLNLTNVLSAVSLNNAPNFWKIQNICPPKGNNTVVKIFIIVGSVVGGVLLLAVGTAGFIWVCRNRYSPYVRIPQETHQEPYQAQYMQSPQAYDPQPVEKPPRNIELEVFNAVRTGDQENVLQLMTEISDINYRDVSGNTFVHYAASFGNVNILQILIHKSALLNLLNNQNQSPLHLAASINSAGVIQLLLAAKANPNLADHEGKTALYMVVEKNHVENARLLLGADANPNARTNSNMTPLKVAHNQKNQEIITLLLHAKANPSECPELLSFAVEKNNAALVKLLLSLRVNMETTNAIGETALVKAFILYQRDILKLLLAERINLEAKAQDGRTILHEATTREDTEIVTLLLTKEVNLEAKTNSGWTPLHYAASKGHINIMKLLLDAGANPDAMNDEGRTPLNLASHTKAVKLLRAVKSNNNAPIAAVKPPLPNIPAANLAFSFKINFTELTFGKELGKGKFGIVKEGTYRNFKVAIKELYIKNPTSQALEEFQQEMAIMARLNCPQIVRFYGVYATPSYGIVMEYLPKGSLYQVLHNNSEPLEWKVRYQIASDVAVGLSFLHKENIIHRDLKSLNVLVDNAMHARVADFGLSKIKSESSIGSDQLAGTPQWMAPELFKQKSHTRASDIYSFGMILWELVSRKRPFEDAPSLAVAMYWIAEGQQEKIPAECPLKLSQFIKFCWNKEPAARPTADEAVMQLKAEEQQSMQLSYRDNLNSGL